MSQASADSKLLAVMMLDIDHFKLYNDYYDHQKGDECLQQVATALHVSTSPPLASHPISKQNTPS
ncbi:hypothetical protein HAALTHF_39310n [Vreelandella aquamarina]|nr:hypothetical protein HAALTHF_39310n [Halomonas axialensis]